MKQTVQQLRRNQGRVANRKPSMPAPVRSVVAHKSNHVQANNKWERQADEAALRIQRGEKNVANRLTPTNAASFRLPGSVGQVLPDATRKVLEEGFGADLSAVRIHNNSQADSAARQQGAKAFTSGAHVYFRNGFYRSHSQTGMELLSHEISHVLQQTGRPAWGGGVRASNINSIGDIQREWDFNEFLSPYREHAELPTEAERPHSPDEVAAQESFRRIEQAIRNVIGLDFNLAEGQGESEAAIQLEVQIVGGGFENETTEAKSLLFDVLKIWRRFNGAAHLVVNDPDIQTRYYQNDLFYDFLVASDEYGNAAVENLLESDHPDFHNIWPYNLTTSLWHYLTQPERELQTTTAGYPADYASVWGEYERRDENYIPNELYLIAKNEMQLADTLRFNSVMAAIERFGEDEGSFWYKKFIANHLVGALGSGESGESPIVRQARLSLRRIAVDANEYWGQVLALHDELRSAMAPRLAVLLRNVGDLANFPRPDYEFPEEEILWELVNTVEEHTEHMFYSHEDPTEPAVLGQTQYSTAVANCLTELEPFVDRLSEHVRNIFVYSRRDETQLASRVRWLGWAQVWLYLFRAMLSSRDAAATNADRRLRHRLHIAGYLGAIGVASGNEYLLDTAEGIFAGEDVGESYILLSDRWRATTNDVGVLTDDYTSGTTIQGLGVTVHQMVMFYHLLYQSDTAERLMVNLQAAPGNEAEESEHRKSIRQLRENYNSVMNSERLQSLFPTRYENQDALINYYAGDELSLGQVISKRHPDGSLQNTEYAQFIQTYSGGDARRMLLPLGRATSLFIWVMPPYQALYDVLHEIDLLQAMVSQDITDPTEWIFALGRAMEEQLTAPQREELTSGLGDVYDQLSVAAFAWRRRNYTEEIRSRLIVAAENWGDISHYTDMGEALDVMREFSFRIRPRGTIEPQMTTMMLDLADELHAALLDEPSEFEQFFGFETRVDTRYDVIAGYYGMINHALEFLAEAGASDRVAAVVVVDDQLQGEGTEGQRRERVQVARQARSTELLNKQSVLQGIKDELSEAITRIQLGGIGFEGRRSGVKSFNYASTLPLMEEMHYDGKVYLIYNIYTDFNYFPPYASGEEAEHPSILFRVSGSNQTRDSREGRRRLLRYTEDGREFDVTTHSSDDHHLALLANVIEEAAFVRSMENLAEVIEGAAELTLDLLELVPGFGQGLMVARMGVEITRFIVEDLPGIRDALSDPREMFNQLETWFAGDDWIENILEYLIFNADTFTLPAALTGSSEDTNHSRRRRHGGLDRLIHSIRTLGEKVLYVFQLLQRNVRGGMVRAQLRLIEYRTLMSIVELLPGLVLTTAQLATMVRDWGEAIRLENPDTPLTPSQLLADLMNSEEDIETQIQNTFIKIAEGLHNVELPETIVPMESVVDVLMGYVLDRFGRKGRLLNDFLQVVGAREGMANQISDHLVEGSKIDINLHWRNNFRQPLQEKLISLQESIIDEGLNPVIRQTLGAQYIVDVSSLGQPGIGVEPSEVPEAEPYNKGERDEHNMQPRWPGLSSGRSLSYPQQLSLESEFGHDLSHVRVHDDEGANRFTESADAYALTSGSHIFLSSDTNINHNSGRHILRHEVAHVLQQTGDRPLDESHSEQPKAGRPGVGVRHDTRREAAADRMADLAGSGEGFVPVEEEGGEGLYPASRQFVCRMLNYLSNSQLSEQVVEDMEDRIPRMSGEERRSFDVAKRDARDLWRAVNREIGTGAQRDFDDSLYDGRSLISAAMGTLYDGAAEVIDALTFRSVRQRSNGLYRLRPERFLNQLRTYIYGKSGITLSISETEGRVTRVRVTYLHLGNTPTRYTIWTDRSNGVKHNTEQAMRSSTSFDAEQLDVVHRNWPRIREYIRSLSYTSRNVWHDSDFRLHNQFIREVAEQFRPVADDEVEIGDWEQYTTPTLSASERRVGLRVATHGQLSQRPSRTPAPPAPTGETSTRGEDISDAAKTGRESHHIPQYLLVEYFRNRASTKMFPIGSSRLPGFDATEDPLNNFDGGTGKQINLGVLDPGGASNRGLNLPAVSIAAVTHQRGQLHVNQTGQWNEDLENGIRDARTQSLWLDYYFYQQIERNTRGDTEEATATSSKSTIIERVRDINRTEPDRAKTAVYSAMISSYETMYNNMMAVFKPALVRYEIPYYRDIAMAHPRQTMSGDELRTAYRPSDTRLETVKAAVARKNETIMHEWR